MYLEEKNINEMFIKKFKEISGKNWMPGVNKSTNSVGLTFEKMLDKKADSMFFPDYYGIEIKCSQRYSGYPISLFSLALDGPKFYETNRILEKYGKIDLKYPNRKILTGEVKVNDYSLINGKYFFKLKIDRNTGRIYICIYDINYHLIEKNTYVEFSTIKNRLEIKLHNMALVLASKKIIDNHPHFRYYQINLYKLKSFETFIDLLEKDIIKVKIELRISRSGIEEGRQRNKGLVFQISKEDIDLLFDQTFMYTTDKKQSINYTKNNIN